MTKEKPIMKIRRSGERIWVKDVEVINSTHAKGLVDSYPINKDIPQYGEEIFFKRDEVLEVFND